MSAISLVEVYTAPLGPVQDYYSLEPRFAEETLPPPLPLSAIITYSGLGNDGPWHTFTARFESDDLGRFVSGVAEDEAGHTIMDVQRVWEEDGVGYTERLDSRGNRTTTTVRQTAEGQIQIEMLGREVYPSFVKVSKYLDLESGITSFAINDGAGDWLIERDARGKLIHEARADLDAFGDSLCNHKNTTVYKYLASGKLRKITMPGMGANGQDREYVYTRPQPGVVAVKSFFIPGPQGLKGIEEERTYNEDNAVTRVVTKKYIPTSAMGKTTVELVYG